MIFCMIHVKKRYFDVLQISCKRETPFNILIFFYIQMFYERGLIGLFFCAFLYVIFQKQIFSHIYIKENKVQKETPIMKIEKEELGEKVYDAFMFLAIIALIVCFCFADKPHTDKITEKRVTVTVQDKFSEMDTSETLSILFADTDYYLTVSMKNDTDLHDVEVSKRQYHSLGKGSKVKCIVTYRNGKVDDIELDED